MQTRTHGDGPGRGHDRAARRRTPAPSAGDRACYDRADEDTPRAARLSNRRGASPTRAGALHRGLGMALAAVALALGVVWLTRSPRGAAEGARVADAPAALGAEDPSQRPPAPAGTAPLAGSVREDPNRGPVAAGPIQVGRPDETGRAQYERSFDGTGTIAVDVRVGPGVTFPASWTLHLEPSPFAEGRDRAVRRAREFPGEQRSVEEVDLPMAAYRVFATAPGFASVPQEVILHRIAGQDHLPGVTFVRVVTTLQPSATVAGAVRNARGEAADALPVTLRAVSGDRRLAALTAVNGTFEFGDVPPGEYAVLLGDPDRPLTPPTRVQVALGRVEVPPMALPPLLHLELRAIDALERPVPGAALSGYRRAEGGGSLRGVTDGDGVLRLRYVQPGAWRFDGTFEVLGLEGRHDATLAVSGDGRDGAGSDGLQRVDIYLAKADPAR